MNSVEKHLGASHNAPMEASEIQEFSNQLKEANEGERHAEPLINISLAISILAVLLQARAGDQWSEYQAKRIREENLSVVIDTLSLQSTPNPATLQKIAEYKTHIAKWTGELAEEQHKAREFEAQVHDAEAQALRYDLGEALLQISVVLCSITLFTRKHSYFILGLGVGICGLLVAATALLVR